MSAAAASFRLRAKIDVEREKGGGWHLLVSEIPYGVQKAKLIEQIAALIADKKLPILADVRDESDEQVRLILEPRARTVDPELLIESLYRLTDLEIRFPLNLNVLDENRTPGVMSLKEALAAWLKFQREVLVRKSQVRIGKIDERLELLDGFLIAFLNLDRVIAIIRTEDEPKPVMMAEFSLTERQAEAILNMRLRSLRKLEEMEIGRERSALAQGAGGASATGRDEARQWRRLKADLKAVKAKFGDERRTQYRRDRAGARDRLVGDDREGADHRHPVAARLDPGDEGAHRRCRRPQMARGRRPVHPLPRPDHRPPGLVRLERAGLHAGAATSCRVRAGSASRCGCSSTSMPKSTSSSCSSCGRT